MTPLMFAVLKSEIIYFSFFFSETHSNFCCPGDEVITEMLVKNGADINIKNIRGKAALDIATAQKGISWKYSTVASNYHQ